MTQDVRTAEAALGISASDVLDLYEAERGRMLATLADRTVEEVRLVRMTQDVELVLRGVASSTSLDFVIEQRRYNQVLERVCNPHSGDVVLRMLSSAFQLWSS